MPTVLTQCTSKWKSFSDIRFKQRAIVEFLTVEKVPPTEIQRQMQAVYGDQCVDASTVRWFKDGELGQADLSDKTRSGRPVTASDQLHQDGVEDFVDLVICTKIIMLL
jgi:hypothetical protein